MYTHTHTLSSANSTPPSTKSVRQRNIFNSSSSVTLFFHIIYILCWPFSVTELMGWFIFLFFIFYFSIYLALTSSVRLISNRDSIWMRLLNMWWHFVALYVRLHTISLPHTLCISFTLSFSLPLHSLLPSLALSDAMKSFVSMRMWVQISRWIYLCIGKIIMLNPFYMACLKFSYIYVYVLVYVLFGGRRNAICMYVIREL